MDKVPQMLVYAQKIANETGASVHVMSGDMQKFSLQVCLTSMLYYLACSADPVNVLNLV